MLVIYVFILVYAASRFEDVSILSVHSGSEWYTYLTYQFTHTNIFHLSINSLMVYLYWRVIKKTTNKYLSITICAISSILAGFGATGPTIGGSSIVFSLFGIYAVCNSLPIKKKLQFYATSAILISIPAINGNIAFLVHVYAIFISITLSFILKRYFYGK